MALASGLAARPDVELHLLTPTRRRGPLGTRSRRRPRVHGCGARPPPGPPRLGAGAGRVARDAARRRRVARAALHDAVARRRPERRDDPRPHVLRSSRVARAQQGRVLPPDDPRRRAAGDRARVRELVHRRPACARSSIPRSARSSSRITVSITTASSRTATTRPTSPRSPRTASSRPTSRSRARSNRARTSRRSCARSRASPRRDPSSDSCSPAPTDGEPGRHATRSRRAASRPACIRPGYLATDDGARVLPAGRGGGVPVVRGGLRPPRARRARVRCAGRHRRRLGARRGRRGRGAPGPARRPDRARRRDRARARRPGGRRRVCAPRVRRAPRSSRGSGASTNTSTRTGAPPSIGRRG